MKMSLMFFKLHMQPTALLCELENKCKVTIIHYAPKIYLRMQILFQSANFCPHDICTQKSVVNADRIFT